MRSHDEIDIPLYKEYDCLQKFMAFRVFQECNCYPDYIDSIYNWMSELGLNNLIGWKLRTILNINIYYFFNYWSPYSPVHSHNSVVVPHPWFGNSNGAIEKLGGNSEKKKSRKMQNSTKFSIQNKPVLWSVLVTDFIKKQLRSKNLF